MKFPISKAPTEELGALTNGWRAFWALLILLFLNTGIAVYLVETHSHQESVGREEFRDLKEQVRDLNEAMINHKRRYGE